MKQGVCAQTPCFRDPCTIGISPLPLDLPLQPADHGRNEPHSLYVLYVTVIRMIYPGIIIIFAATSSILLAKSIIAQLFGIFN